VVISAGTAMVIADVLDANIPAGSPHTVTWLLPILLVTKPEPLITNDFPPTNELIMGSATGLAPYPIVNVSG
jgi:hypothetical protein